MKSIIKEYVFRDIIRKLDLPIEYLTAQFLLQYKEERCIFYLLDNVKISKIKRESKTITRFQSHFVKIGTKMIDTSCIIMEE